MLKNLIKQFLEQQVLHRFNSVDVFNSKLSEFVGFDIKLEKLQKETWWIDDRFGCSFTAEETDFHINVFYVLDNDKRMVITEYTLDTDPVEH